MKSPLLPVLAALGLLFGGSAASASTSPASSTPSSAQTIYAGSFQNNWQYWGWAQAESPCPSPALSANSLRVQEGAYQAIYLHHTALTTNTGQVLSFWINGGSAGGQKLSVTALRNNNTQIVVGLSPLKANSWQQVQISLPRLGVGAVSDCTGFWIWNRTAGTQAPFFVDNIVLSQGTASAPAPPAAPGGLSAMPSWAKSCPVCGGMAMAHIVTSWNAVSGATSYTVYRNGVKQINQAAPGWTDMDVTSGQTYSYAVSATGAGGEGAKSASVSATAPNPPATAGVLTAPVNLSVQGSWAGAPADTLSWSPVPGAASYNVYQYGTQIASGLKTPAYFVPASVYCNGMTYAVTAVDSMGMESLPSAVSDSMGLQDPAQQPGWMPGLPPVPENVVAVPEWNGGLPRVHLLWKGDGSDYTYSVYRDGKKVAAGLWGLSFYDTTVQPGETHEYAVTGVNTPWTLPVESQPSAAVSATALSSAPAAQAAAVQITGVQADDDSAVISFDAVPGAADYRVYSAANPNTVKYSGGSLSIEMNGLDPVSGANLIVEAVDKLGPFQTMDGMAGPGAMQMGTMHQAINGQGNPSDIPNVLAVSAPTHVALTPRSLTGSQAFFDTFRGEQPLTLQPMPSLVPGTFYGLPDQYAEYANDKWAMRDYGGDIADSAVFFMGNHFMDTLFDGGTPHTGDPMHNNNASLVMMPKTTEDISGGRVLHVTFEVDPHMDPRRWCDVFVAPAGDTLVDPSKFSDFPDRRPTVDGKLFRWEIHDGVHSLNFFPGVHPDAQSDIVNLTHQDSGIGPDSGGICARSGPWCAIPFNGTCGDLDKRHKFDLYLSSNRAVIMEQGLVVKDAAFPAGMSLPFDKCQVYFVHQVYHTGNDRPELIGNDRPETVGTNQSNSYWYNNRPFSDERHWDNMGVEVLSAFP